ncbi:MAG: site-specific DNA-methyltransferase [Verrucomicrobiota bacterium]
MNVRKILTPSPIEFEETEDTWLLEGDVREVLSRLPDNFVQCVITSPPYWGLRDYGIPGQIGLESTLDGYLHNLTQVFSEIHRVLKPDGIVWINIGDGYTSGNRGWRAPDKKNPNRAMAVRPDNPPGLKDKDLIGVPWRLAFMLQANGWYLRSDIIWHKPNVMPESVKDRPTRAHEYLFMLTKEEQYTYHSNAVMEPTEDGKQRNRRTVWSINTTPSIGTHIASFPQELVEPCILAATQPGDKVLDPFSGVGTVGLVCQRLHRKYIGVELNSHYAAEAEQLLARNGPARPANGSNYPPIEYEHQVALLETPGKHRKRA